MSYGCPGSWTGSRSVRMSVGGGGQFDEEEKRERRWCARRGSSGWLPWSQRLSGVVKRDVAG